MGEVPNDVERIGPRTFSDTINGGPSSGHNEILARNTLAKYKQFYSLTPVCRIHVYQRNQGKAYGEPGRLPSHWCGETTITKEGNSIRDRASNRPDFIFGKEGVYLNQYAIGSQRTPMDWQLLDARVNTTRQWQSSSAMFQIACPMDANTSAKAPPIRPNDVIVIEMGYCNGMDSTVSLPTGRTNYQAFVGDVVFYGIVDTIKERGGSGDKDGVVVSVMARDAMSILTDNKMRGHYNPLNLNNYNRAFLIRDLIWRGAAIDNVMWQKKADGTFETEKNADGTDTGFRIPVYAPGGSKQMISEPFGTNNCYVNIGVLEKSQRKEIIIPEEGNQSGIQLTDRYPLDLIRHFSLVETAPRELWSDRRSGNIHWEFRRTDMRRLLTDPNSRQYFYRFPSYRANVIAYTMEWSTAGTVTHFTISNPTASAQNSSKMIETYAESPTALLTDPHAVDTQGFNRMRPLTRNRFIYDDTLIGEESSALVAGALFNIWGKCIETGMVMVPGDPSLEIGEAIQMFNSGLFGKRFHENVQEQNNVSGPGHPEGIFRIEGVTHLFAVGGIGKGYQSVFILGPIDEDTGTTNPDTGKTSKRLIKSDPDLYNIEVIDVEDQANNGNEQFKGTPA